MRGHIIELDRMKKNGKVETGNDDIGILTIYFKELDEKIKIGSTVEFEIQISKWGNMYAKFIELVERNNAIFNTEDRVQWYNWGENEELDFIRRVVPYLSLDIRINPEKTEKKWAIDLYDYTRNRPADLKTQNTPFFTAGKYTYNSKTNNPKLYNPSYTVTFNKKDYEYYQKDYPECDIYFWVNWTQTEYKNITVLEVHGVWRARFEKMVEKIRAYNVALHSYQSRVTDDHNAKESYLFDLQDTDVFERVR